MRGRAERLLPPGTDTSFELTVATVPAEGTTTEINDRRSTSYPLTLPQGPLTASMRNTLDIDWDVHSIFLDGTTGVDLAVNGGISLGNESWSYFVITDENLVARRYGIIDENYLADSRFFPGTRGMFYVFVTDYRYLAPGVAPGTRPQDAAGTPYSIDLTAIAAPLVETASSSPMSMSITARGASRWVRINHSGGMLFVKGLGDSLFSPGVTIWRALGDSPFTPVVPLAGVESDVVALDLGAGAYVVESNELYGFTGAYQLLWQSIDLGPGGQRLTPESDTDADSTLNDTCATADPIAGPPGAALGRLTVGDVDSFVFTADGNNVLLRTAAAGLVFVDTAVELYQVTGGVPALIGSNDDENAFLGQYYSVLQATVTPGATYCVQVSGATSTESGPYSLVLTSN